MKTWHKSYNEIIIPTHDGIWPIWIVWYIHKETILNEKNNIADLAGVNRPLGSQQLWSLKKACACSNIRPKAPINISCSNDWRHQFNCLKIHFSNNSNTRLPSFGQNLHVYTRIMFNLSGILSHFVNQKPIKSHISNFWCAQCVILMANICVANKRDA